MAPHLSRLHPHWWLCISLLCMGCDSGSIDRPDPDLPHGIRFDGPSRDLRQRRDSSPSPDTAADDQGGMNDMGQRDTGHRDMPAPPPDGPRDAPPASDADPCKPAAGWSCKAEDKLLCSATCGTNRITCTNGGTCQCEFTIGPCGTFSGMSPCAVCEKAIAANCCLFD